MTTGKDRYAVKYRFAVTRVSGASGCGESLVRLDKPRDWTRHVRLTPSISRARVTRDHIPPERHPQSDLSSIRLQL
jgi:hypothetical protein